MRDDARAAAAETLRDRLLSAVLPEGRGQLLFDLAQYHPPEKKPAAWAVFDSAAKDAGDLCEDPDSLGGLVAISAMEPVTTKSSERTYRWPWQEAKFRRGSSAAVALAGETFPVHVPFRVVKRGGRKEMQLPQGATQPRRTDNTLVKALARAFRWKRMLESGEYPAIAELAESEGIAPSYMTRVLRLTLRAPDIVEAILNGKQGPEVTLARMLEPFPGEWEVQQPYLRPAVQFDREAGRM